MNWFDEHTTPVMKAKRAVLHRVVIEDLPGSEYTPQLLAGARRLICVPHGRSIPREIWERNRVLIICSGTS